MADLAIHRPLEGFQAPPELGLSTGPTLVRYNLRAGEATLPRVADALGFALPQLACRSASVGGRHALWLGPDEWLLLCAPGDMLGDEVETALLNEPHSLVEVSCRQTALNLDGPHAAQLLAAGCPLDLSERAFPIGMCTRTLFGKSEIVLWRTGDTAFHIEVWRSFAGYVCGLLQAAGAG